MSAIADLPDVQPGEDSRAERPSRRERSRSRDRRSRSRSRDRRRRSRSRSRDRRRYRSRSRDRRRRRSYSRSPDRSGAVPRLLITQLPFEIEKEPLTVLFARQGFIPTELRIFNKSDRGSTRTFAVVEFVDVDTAKAWMERNQGMLTLNDGRKSTVEYERNLMKQRLSNDWLCAKCATCNYTLRETCFKCETPKDDSALLEKKGFGDIGLQATDTLLLRDLPQPLTEDRIDEVMKRVTGGQIPILRVVMSESREYAYVQVRSPEECEMLVAMFTKAPLQINQAIVIITFSRRSLSLVLSAPSLEERKGRSTQMTGQMAIAAATASLNVPPPSAFNATVPPPTIAMVNGRVLTVPQQPNLSQPPPSMMQPVATVPGMAAQNPYYQQQLLFQQQQQALQQQQLQAQIAQQHALQQQMLVPAVGSVSMSVPPPTIPAMARTPTQTQLVPGAIPGMNMSVPPPGLVGVQQQQLVPGQYATIPGMMPATAMPQAMPVTTEVPPPSAMPNMANVVPGADMVENAKKQNAFAAHVAQQKKHMEEFEQQLKALKAQQEAAALQKRALEQQGQVAAVQQPPATLKGGVCGNVQTPVGLMPRYLAPDPSKYVYEPTSGYMHDPVTNFYYDPASTYFYNSITSKWTYYDATYSTYLPVEQKAALEAAVAGGAVAATPGLAPGGQLPASDEKKTPAEIAKEMAKWAKKQEKKGPITMSLKPLVKPLETKSAFGSSKVSATPAPGAASNGGRDPTSDLTFKMLEKQTAPLSAFNGSDSEDEVDPRELAARARSKKVEELRRESGSGSGSGSSAQSSAAEEREKMERELIDRERKTCLLCRRAFHSGEALDKHIDKSELHKTNLEAKRVEWGKTYVQRLLQNESSSGDTAPSSSYAPKTVYRDRAKERRNMHGIDAITDYSLSAMDDSRDEDTIRRESDMVALRPIESSNIGNKLLKNMGWQEGLGVGKNLQGIVNPVQAERRVEGAGLGVAGSRITHGVNASHSDKVKAALFSRYHDS